MFFSRHSRRAKNEVSIMKNNILYALFLTILNITAMDTPPGVPAQEVPVELQIKFSQERDRFRSYNLENPEAKFLPLLRTQLKKEDLSKYLRNLNIFLNNLIAQHFLLQKAAEINYISKEIVQLKTQEQNVLQQMGAKTDPSDPTNSVFNVPSIDVLNEVTAHNTIAKKRKELLTPQELQIVFNWEFDDRFDPWLKLLSKNRLFLNLILPILNLRNAELKKFDAQLNQILFQLEKNFEKLPALIQRNTQSIPTMYEAYQKARKRFELYEQKEVKSQTTLDSLANDYFDTISPAGHLYQYTHQWYEQLYTIVRAELKATIDALMKAEPAKIKEFTKYMGNEFTNVLPDKVFPIALPPFKDPRKTVTLPSVDKERAEAKKIWDEQQKRREEARKRNNKIQQTPDGSSYILEYQDTPTSITIHNNKNKTQEVIFKHEHPNEIDRLGLAVFPIKYTDWVKQWFANPQEALETQGYNNPASLKFRAGEPEWKPIVLHAFSPLIDDYIKQWGRVTTTKNRRNPAQEDTLITIPGKMIYPSGAEEAGIFAYIIDSQNGQWYHRMFTPGTLSELTKNLFEKGYFSPQMTGYYDAFFPPLVPRKK
jgi:hypothetical protein